MQKAMVVSAVSLLVGLTGLVSADTKNDPASRITRFVSAELPPDGAGLAIGVYRDGEALYEKGFGLADLEHGTTNTVDTVFHIASVSKQFTAFAIKLLERRGELSLDDDIRQYLPRVPDFGKTITIRHLIHHTSGLRDQWLLLNLSGQSFSDHLTQEQILNLVERQRELNFSPGSAYSYSNTGYTLLAEIVSRVSGQSFREFTASNIFEPLGMKSSFFHDEVSELVPGRAHSYHWDDAEQQWENVLLSYETVGATSMFTTVRDMARWARNFSSPSIGGRDLVAEMLVPGELTGDAELRYASGLIEDQVLGHRMFMHGGADAAFRSLFAYLPESELVVVVLANTPFDRLRLLPEIVDAVLGPSPGGSFERQPKEVEPPRGLLDSIEGSYVSANGPMIRFEQRDGALYRVTAGDDGQPVVFRDDETFDMGYPARNWSYYRIGGIQEGRASSLVEVRPTDPSSAVFVHRRITPMPVKDMEPGDYTGWYYSRELDTSYWLTEDAGKLMASAIWKADPIELEPVLVDRFDTDLRLFRTVSFERGDGGEVLGFRVLLGRFNQIPFRRITSRFDAAEMTTSVTATPARHRPQPSPLAGSQTYRLKAN